jgi:3-oxoacyl-[acyl-carrier protein] reductase
MASEAKKHMFDFDDRVLVLTGANGGIGREVARLFYAHGAQLVLSDANGEGVAEFGAVLDPSGRRVVTLEVNAADPEGAERTVAVASKRFGGIDFLVPSAGIYLSKPFIEMTDDDWRQTLSINLDGVFYICSRSAPYLRDGSALVNLTSIAAHRGAQSNSHYSTSKGGILALTRSLARELAPRTRVNTVSPGVIETSMTKDLIERRGLEQVEQTPLKRFGTPSEVANAVGFLCSGAASFITGEVLHVNGGLYMD